MRRGPKGAYRRQGRPTTRRHCLRCDRDFTSDGPHHRLCAHCRAANARDPEAYGRLARRIELTPD